MSKGPYEAHEYSKGGFTCDAKLQELLTERSKRVDRNMNYLLVSFFILFLVSILLAYAGFIWVLVIIIPLGFILPGCALFYLPPPKYRCLACGNKMQREMESIGSSPARHGEFLVCKPCNLYAYTHRASRP